MRLGRHRRDEHLTAVGAAVTVLPGAPLPVDPVPRHARPTPLEEQPAPPLGERLWPAEEDALSRRAHEVAEAERRLQDARAQHQAEVAQAVVQLSALRDDCTAQQVALRLDRDRLEALRSELQQLRGSAAQREAVLADRAAAVESARAETEARARALLGRERAADARADALLALVQEVDQREAGLAARQRELQRAADELGAREQALAEDVRQAEERARETDAREADLTAREARSAAREAELVARDQDLLTRAVRLDDQADQLVPRRAALDRREDAVAARERAVDARAAQAGEAEARTGQLEQEIRSHLAARFADALRRRAAQEPVPEERTAVVPDQRAAPRPRRDAAAAALQSLRAAAGGLHCPTLDAWCAGDDVDPADELRTLLGLVDLPAVLPELLALSACGVLAVDRAELAALVRLAAATRSPEVAGLLHDLHDEGLRLLVCTMLGQATTCADTDLLAQQPLAVLDGLLESGSLRHEQVHDLVRDRPDDAAYLRARTADTTLDRGDVLALRWWPEAGRRLTLGLEPDDAFPDVPELALARQARELRRHGLDALPAGSPGLLGELVALRDGTRSKLSSQLRDDVTLWPVAAEALDGRRTGSPRAHPFTAWLHHHRARRALGHGDLAAACDEVVAALAGQLTPAARVDCLQLLAYLQVQVDDHAEAAQSLARAAALGEERDQVAHNQAVVDAARRRRGDRHRVSPFVVLALDPATPSGAFDAWAAQVRSAATLASRVREQRECELNWALECVEADDPGPWFELDVDASTLALPDGPGLLRPAPVPLGRATDRVRPAAVRRASLQLLRQRVDAALASAHLDRSS